jgi:hypothetical protein
MPGDACQDANSLTTASRRNLMEVIMDAESVALRAVTWLIARMSYLVEYAVIEGDYYGCRMLDRPLPPAFYRAQ